MMWRFAILVVFAALGVAAFFYLDEAMWWRCREAPTRACVQDYAWAEAAKLFDESERYVAEARILNAQSEADPAGAVEAAHRLAKTPAAGASGRLDRDLLQLTIVQVLARAGRFSEAEAALKAIEWDHVHDWAVEVLAEQMVTTCSTAELVALAGRVRKAGGHAERIVAFVTAPAAVQRGDEAALLPLLKDTRAVDAIPEAFATTNEDDHVATHVEPMAIIAMAQLRAGRASDAIATAQSVQNWRGRAEVLAGLGTLSAGAGWRADLMQVLEAIAAMPARERRTALRLVLLPRLSPLFSLPDRFGHIDLRPLKVDAAVFFDAYVVGPRPKHTPQTVPVDQMAAQVAAVFAADEERALAYAAVAAAGAAAGEADAALALVDKIGAPWPSVKALLAIAEVQQLDSISSDPVRATLARAHAAARMDGRAAGLLRGVLYNQAGRGFIEDALATVRDTAITTNGADRSGMARDIASGMGATPSPDQDFDAAMRASRLQDLNAFAFARLGFAVALAERGRIDEALIQIAHYRKVHPPLGYEEDTEGIHFMEPQDAGEITLRDIAQSRAVSGAYDDARKAVDWIIIHSMRAEALLSIAQARRGRDEHAQADAALREALALVGNIRHDDRRFEVLAAAIRVAR